jgi:carboxypeptidase D
MCGYDLNLTYPQQGGHFPSLDAKHAARSLGTVNTGRKSVVDIKKRLRNVALYSTLHGTNHTKRSLGRRSLEGRANGTLDPWYECDLFNELWDYALNYTFPRSKQANSDFSQLSIDSNSDTDYEIADPDDVAGVSKPAPGHPVVFFDS